MQNAEKPPTLRAQKCQHRGFALFISTTWLIRADPGKIGDIFARPCIIPCVLSGKPLSQGKSWFRQSRWQPRTHRYWSKASGL